MAATDTEPGDLPPGSSVADLILSGAKRAIRESLAECGRAERRRGNVVLEVELALGDDGQRLWLTHSLVFREKLHRKDAARESSNG